MSSETLVQHMVKLEAEADAIVASARQEARRMLESVAQQVAALRKERELALQHELEAFGAAVQQRTERELEAIQTRASEAMRRLESVGEGAISEAVAMVIKRLREG